MHNECLWIRVSLPRSAPSSSGRASRRPLSGSASPSPPSACRFARSRSASGGSCSTAPAAAWSRPRRACASTGTPSACSRSRSSCSARSAATRRGTLFGPSRDRGLHRPRRHRSAGAPVRVPAPPSRRSRRAVGVGYAARRRASGSPGARARGRGGVATPPGGCLRVVLQKMRFSTPACPPGASLSRGRTITLDELRTEPLIVMQEGAGVGR